MPLIRKKNSESLDLKKNSIKNQLFPDEIEEDTKEPVNNPMKNEEIMARKKGNL